MQESPREAPPDTIHGQDGLLPRPPFSFLKEALPGGFGPEGRQLLFAWVAFTALTSSAWALHLRSLAGWSALPSHWGERLSARELWELVEHGGLKQAPFGALVPILGLGALVWALWAGWRMQARQVDLPHHLGPWFRGGLDTLLIGVLPLLLPTVLGTTLLQKAASGGIQGLGWLNLVLGGLFRGAFVSALMLQWWFCRLDRAAGYGPGFRGYRIHLGHSFLRIWSHPIQWFLLVFGGTALRTGLGFGALILGWRWGGGSATRVWTFLILQLGAAAASAWLIGYLLRLSALFWKQDRRVRQAVADLRASASPSILESSLES